MSCCINRYTFHTSLLEDARHFSRYVGGGAPIPRTFLSSEMTSALHVEMKLWRPIKSLPKIRYKVNDAQHNSWRAMLQMGVRNLFTNKQVLDIWIYIAETHHHSIKAFARSECVLLEYDKWMLDTICFLRASGRGCSKFIGQHKTLKPTALATIGLAQKLLNIYVKYLACWGLAGKFTALPVPGGFTPAGPSNSSPLYSLIHSVCAPHAPIDRILIEELKKLPLGKEMIKRDLLAPYDQKLHEVSGGYWPWSKLDCLKTYYGFQLIFRRLAIHTWPTDCARTCFGSENGLIGLIKTCAKQFDEWFPDIKQREGPDWIQAALDIPEDVIANTVDQIAII